MKKSKRLFSLIVIASMLLWEINPVLPALARQSEETKQDVASKRVLVKVLKKEINKELVQQTGILSKDEIENGVEKSVLLGLKDSGLNYIERFGIQVSTDITKQLPDKWYKAASDDVVGSFVKHYQKHVQEELPKVGKQIMSMEKYLDDAVKFWEQNSSKAIDWSISDGNGGSMVGKKIVIERQLVVLK